MRISRTDNINKQIFMENEKKGNINLTPDSRVFSIMRKQGLGNLKGYFKRRGWVETAYKTCSVPGKYFADQGLGDIAKI